MDLFQTALIYVYECVGQAKRCRRENMHEMGMDYL